MKIEDCEVGMEVVCVNPDKEGSLAKNGEYKISAVRPAIGEYDDLINVVGFSNGFYPSRFEKAPLTALSSPGPGEPLVGKVVIPDPDLVSLALRNQRGEDQKLIAETGIEMVALLLRKNSDYGSSAWKPPVLAPHLNVGDAMLCRMSDKVARIGTLATGSPEVAESLEDTIRDLGGYCLLWLAERKRTK